MNIENSNRGNEILKKPAKKTGGINMNTLVVMALMTALIILLGVSVGTIMIGPVGITLMHIPVIIGAIVLGAKYGAVLGFFMGLVSFMIASFTPFPGAFAFSPFVALPGSDSGSLLALVVCFVPRILIGIVAVASFKLFNKIFKKKTLAYGLAALAGTLTNTILVLSFIGLFFSQSWSAVNGIAQTALIGAMLVTVFTNGIPEAVVAFFVALGVGSFLSAVKSRDEKKIKTETEAFAARNNELLANNESLKNDIDKLKQENDMLKNAVSENSETGDNEN